MFHPLVNKLYTNISGDKKATISKWPLTAHSGMSAWEWSGDTEFFVPTAAYDFDVQSFFSAAHDHVLRGFQHTDGSYPNVAPDLNAGSGGRCLGRCRVDLPLHDVSSLWRYQYFAAHYASFTAITAVSRNHASNYVNRRLARGFLVTG